VADRFASSNSIANPQQVFPLAKVTLESDAFGHPMTQRSICFPLFPSRWQTERYSRRER
jgi:hypothetical protein